MKQFIVTLPSLQMPANVGGGYNRPTTEVEADYFRVQDGVLTFRQERHGHNDYPVAVRVFAPGFWAEVTEHRTLQERVAEHRHPKQYASEIEGSYDD
jgi:hypothetical protein